MNPKTAAILVLALAALAYSSPVEDSEIGNEGQFLDSASIEDNFADATETSSVGGSSSSGSNVVKRGVSSFGLGGGAGAGKGYIFGQGGIGLGGAHLSGGWGFDAHHHSNHHQNNYHHQPKGWGKGHGTVVYHINGHNSNKGGWGWGNDYNTGYSYTAGGWGGHHDSGLGGLFKGHQQKGWGGHY